MFLLGFLQETQTCVKSNLKSTCRVKAASGSATQLKVILTSQKHLLYISTLCPCCSLLSCSCPLFYSSNNLCTHLSLCLECSSLGICKNPSHKSRSYEGFPFKIPTTLSPSSFLPKFLHSFYHHFSYYIYFACLFNACLSYQKLSTLWPRIVVTFVCCCSYKISTMLGTWNSLLNKLVKEYMTLFYILPT